MQFDIFLSICQTPVDGFKPSERQMFLNFFDQVRLADQLGFGCAWVAETHLSCQVQKRNPGAVIPHFEGEIGLNTDILQLATRILSQTRRIHVGSAIRNILCNGGPIAHAEAIKMFMSLHALEDNPRLLEIGFASGRFPFSNTPYGIRPRNQFEKENWNQLKGLIFQEATEIFLRFLRGDIFSSRDVRPKRIGEQVIPSTWEFDDVGVIPFEAPMDHLRLTIGTHDAASHALANEFLPVGVFNLSITPSEVIEQTHERMKSVYNKKGGPWHRGLMPRTVLVFIGDRAHERAEKAIGTYWKAMEGTLDPRKVEQAVGNALVGTPEEVAADMRRRFNPEDRLMLWFDFNNHDNEDVKKSMRLFIEKVAPGLA